MHTNYKQMIEKWLQEHKKNGQWVSDYDGEFDLDNCCLDGSFDLRELCEQIVKSQSSKIKQEMVREIEKEMTPVNQCLTGDPCEYENRVCRRLITIINNSN